MRDTMTPSQMKEFQVLAAKLKAVDIRIELFENGNPIVGSAYLGGVEGFYFRKDGYQNFDSHDEYEIYQVFDDSPGFEVHSIIGVEYEDDRINPAIIVFTKNG